MKKIAPFLISALLIFSSCKKSVTTVTPNPPAIDTSTLVKTEAIYSYDASGNIGADSTSIKWEYDNKRRPTSHILIGYQSQLKDTTSYSYPSNQVTINDVSYLNDILIERGTSTSFLNAAGKVDSITSSSLTISIINGVQYPESSTNVSYSFYDQNGNDILDSTYNIANNNKILGAITRRVYTSNSLDSLIQYNANGQISSFDVYSNGNVISDVEYFNGQILSSHSYTYYDILSGGLYTITGTRNLLKTFTQSIGQPSSTDVETLTYTFDNINRVSIVSRSKANIIYQKEFYTYY